MVIDSVGSGTLTEATRNYIQLKTLHVDGVLVIFISKMKNTMSVSALVINIKKSWSLFAASVLVAATIAPAGTFAQVAPINEIPLDQPICNADLNLVTNGSFEDPSVNNWEVFEGNGVAVPGWTAEWVNSQAFPAQIEIQEDGVLSGVSAQDGGQYAEMDTDFGGNLFEGEEMASIVLKQQISTVAGNKYHVSFWTHPRPGYDEADNSISFEFGSEDDSIDANGNDEVADEWEQHTYEVIATDSTTDLIFTDEGTANTFGMLLDNVVVTRDCSGVTVTAHKIVCPNEASLPDMALAPGDVNITSTTASAFLAQNEDCHAQEGWIFEWGLADSAPEPTDSDTRIGTAGEGWNPMPATDAQGMSSVTLYSEDLGETPHLWFREQLQDGYIPFTYHTNGDTDSNPVSAEMYCAVDNYHYDNYDRIDGIQPGGSYDCVAWNVAEEQPQDDNACNFQEGQLGWYGEYYDYSREHPDMNLDPSLWPDDGHGDPLSVDNLWDTDWFTTDAYYQFAQIDANLMFGENYFPVDAYGSEVDNGHNYHFGNHWIAKVTIPADGEYGWTLTSDDDAWVYIDGNLETANPGIHPPTTINDSAVLTAGEHIVDVYFAERHTTQSHMYFSFDQDLSVRPWNDDCEDDNGGGDGDDREGGYITGLKWGDLDGDGVWDEEEVALGGWTIWVDLNGNGSFDGEEDMYTITGDDDGIADEAESTDALGRYNFFIPIDGTFRVYETLESGWEQTYPEVGYHEVTVSGGGALDINYNFGNRESDDSSDDNGGGGGSRSGSRGNNNNDNGGETAGDQIVDNGGEVLGDTLPVTGTSIAVLGLLLAVFFLIWEKKGRKPAGKKN